ncbi:hypothetical protein Pmani_022121, partial [Petrolisthes manimaculis]
DVLKGCATIVEGLANMSLSSSNPKAARTFTEARLTARIHLDHAYFMIGLHPREDSQFTTSSRNRPSPTNLATSSPFTTVGEEVSHSTHITRPLRTSGASETPP